MKRKISLLFPLLVLMATLVASCEKKTKTEFLQVLKLNLSDDPISLDPRIVRSLKDLTIAKQLFEGLTRMDAQGVPTNAIAQTIHVSEDLLTYTFSLRDAFWSNGDPVTAEDFVNSWRKVLDPSFATDYSYMLYPIKNAKLAREGKCDVKEIEVVAQDEKTLVVTLEIPTPYFLELTAFPTYFPVNHTKGLISEEKNLICNGPFQLKSWKVSQELFLEKNNLYWDKSNVKLDGLLFSIIADANTESHLYEKNELDWLGQPISGNIAAEVLKKIKEEGKLTSYPIAGTFWFKFNTETSPFDQVKVRRAFSLAINRAELINHILQGNQTIATGPLPPSMSLSQSPYFQDGDVERAQKLFEEALEENHWTYNTFPKVVLNYPPTERNSKIVQLVQQQWKKALQVDVELVAVENQLYRGNVRQGLFQIGTGDWIADFNDPLAFLELFKYSRDAKSGNGMNDTGWINPVFVSLLENSLTEKDETERKNLLFAAEKILVDEMPIAPVYHYAFDYVKKDFVCNVLLSPLGTADFKYTTIH